MSALQMRLSNNLSDIAEAELQVHFVPRHGDRGNQNRDVMNQIRVELSEVLPERSDATSGRRVVYIDGKQLDLRRSGQLSFDMTVVVRRWLEAHSSGNGVDGTQGVLEIGLHSSYNADQELLEQLATGLVPPGGLTQDLQPIVWISSHSFHPLARQHRQRQRRQTLSERFCSTPKRRVGRKCCLRQLFVDFHRDLGWNILQPHGFYASHCSGNCLLSWADETPHAQVTGSYYHRYPTAGVQPCCSPQTFDSLTVLYSKKEKNSTVTLVETLPGMVALSCVCR